MPFTVPLNTIEYQTYNADYIECKAEIEDEIHILLEEADSDYTNSIRVADVVYQSHITYTELNYNHAIGECKARIAAFYYDSKFMSHKL